MDKSIAKIIYSEASKFLIDIAKLLFAGMIIGGIMRLGSLNPQSLIAIGTFATLFTFSMGLLLLKISKEE